MPPRIEQMTAAPGEYRQLDPDDPAPQLVAELVHYLGCTKAEAVQCLLELRGNRGR